MNTHTSNDMTVALEFSRALRENSQTFTCPTIFARFMLDHGEVIPLSLHGPSIVTSVSSNPFSKNVNLTVNNRGIISTLSRIMYTGERSRRSCRPVDEESRRLVYSTTSKHVGEFAPYLSSECLSISHSPSHPNKYTQPPS